MLHGLPSGVNVRPARLLQSRGGESGGGEIKGRIGGGGVAIGDGGTCGDRTDGVGCDEHDLMEILSRGGRFVSTHRLSHSAESTHHCMVQNEKYWHNGSSSHRPWHSASLAAPALLNGSPPQCLLPSVVTGLSHDFCAGAGLSWVDREHDWIEILSRGGRFVSTHRLSHSAESTHHCVVQNEKYWHNGSSSHRPWHSASLTAPALLNGSPPQCLRPSDGTG